MNTEHRLQIEWQLQVKEDFSSGEFSRYHSWQLGSGKLIQVSASPMIIPGLSFYDALDPEEAFIGALASCHMLAFLAIAAKRKYLVSHYQDWPVGTLGKMPNGGIGVSSVTLSPEVTFSGNQQPTSEQLAKLHQMAHKACYIANSIVTHIDIQPK